MIHKIQLRTNKLEQMIDITVQVQRFITEMEVEEGIAVVYCPHTTAAVTVNENADPDVVHDILLALNKIYPQNCADYRHGEGNSAAHLKASTFGCSQLIPITSGRLLLGTWQGIYFCEFDGPRQRSLYLKLQKD